jgi:CheY-like chemotaxis protein
MVRILIIDDDELLRGILAKTLENAGHSVIQAADGQQGVELFRATEIDLVITDLVMPVQEGVETIMVLHRERRDLPIIAISGGVMNTRTYLDIAKKVGARRVLPKPFTPQELLRAVDEVVAQQKTPPDPT